MTYDECLNIMFHSLPMYQREGKAAYKADLKRSLEIDTMFYHPHQNYKCIHIAGTNGKGSVSHLMASVLQEAGYKTGLYTSPHLVDFRERIRIDGKMIPKHWILDFMTAHLKTFQRLQASFFEMTAALAFEYFKQEKVDFAVIETGMGGRLDSTNIVNPELSIITNIGYDHTGFLGDTIEKIAAEKAGIIKTNVPIISGSSDVVANHVFKNKAKSKQTDIYFAANNYKLINFHHSETLMHVTYTHKNSPVKITSDLTGKYQVENIATVLSAFDIKKKDWNIPDESIEKGISNVKTNTNLMGRWQKLSDKPTIYCDVAHNTEGLTHVINQIKSFTYENLIIILGVVNDKNLQKILPLFPKNAHYFFTEAKIPRALPAKELQKEANNFGLHGNLSPCVSDAYKKAKEIANLEDFIFIGGSTFTVAEIL
ncbi:MAG: bifunctional folylpolyglutamate synthase/dihydrofolate synthase [Bacteroidales bacterium]|nr:bifunctional folylpolyglutamate synthase/dihydrofolate synthase [Bacteroidales bacterium]